MALKYSDSVPVGWEAADFMLTGTDEESYSPQDFLNKKALLVTFTCNHCPYAQASWPILIDLYEKYKDDVAFIAINPNDDTEYPDDSFEAMQEKKVEWGIPYPYLSDESQSVAKEYKAQCTPDPYLFRNENGTWKLFYHGRINDNWQHPEEVTDHNLDNALQSVVNNLPHPDQQPPSMGCSIKWKS